jgi:hypothetical protein
MPPNSSHTRFLKRFGSSATSSSSRPAASISNGLTTTTNTALTSNKSSHALLQSREFVDTACDEYNQELLHQAVENAGRWAYGIIVVEVWLLAEDQTKLFRPDGGYWFDPTYHEECVGDDCQICRLFNPDKHDYAPPKNVSPGEGLPGALWAEVSVGNWTKNHRESLAKSIINSSTNDKEFRHEITLTHFRTRHIAWRNVQQLNEDPDQPWNQRLRVLADLKLGWAAAVPFSMHGSQGIVIYMARESVDMSRIQSERNEIYLKAATDLIGAACAFGEPRRAAVMERRKELLSTLHRVRDKIISIHRKGLSLKDLVEKEAETHVAPQGRRRNRHFGVIANAGQGVQKTATTMFEKAKGAGVPIPPAFGWVESFFTFLCVLVTMSTLTFLHRYIHNEKGDNYAVAIGPNGALMCLLFGLTAAPAAQPRNAIIGQAVSMAMSLGIASTDVIPLFLRQGLATALSVSVMAKLGVTHPPAAASAAIYASGLVNWPSMGFLLVANVIAVILATAFNNLSSKRQYPTYWGFETIWCSAIHVCGNAQSAARHACDCISPIPRSSKDVPLHLDSSVSSRSKVAPDASTTDRVELEPSIYKVERSSESIETLDP